MSRPVANDQFAQRKQEKEQSRLRDQERLRDGSVSRVDLRRENGFLSSLSIRRVRIINPWVVVKA